jgi:hypothetical protein
MTLAMVKVFPEPADARYMVSLGFVVIEDIDQKQIKINAMILKFSPFINNFGIFVKKTFFSKINIIPLLRKI